MGTTPARSFSVEIDGIKLNGLTYDEQVFIFKGYDGTRHCKIEAIDEFHAATIWKEKQEEYIRGFKQYLKAGGRDWD